MIALQGQAPTDPGTARAEPSGARRLTADAVALAVGIVVVVGHALAVAPSTSLWLDEAYSLAAVNDLGLSLTSTHGTMGLYYLLLWPFGQVSTAAWWIRVPSVLAAVATLVVVRAVARRIGGARLATASVPLLALMPAFEWKAVEARSYSLVALLAALCWYCALRAIDAPTDRESRRWWLLVAPVAVAGSLSHGLFLVHLAPVAAVALLGPNPVAALRRLVPAVVGAVAPSLALLAWGASNVGTHARGGPVNWVRVTYWRMLPGDPGACFLLLVAIAVGFGVSVRGAARATDPVARARAAVPALWAVGPCAALIGISLLAPRFNPRYLAPAAPGLALCLGVAACLVATHVRRSTPTFRLVAATAVLGALLVVTFATGTRAPDQDWRAMADLVAARAEPGDGMLFANVEADEVVQHRPPFEAAWTEADRSVSPVVLTSARPLGEVLRWEDSMRTAPELAAAAEDVDRVWVVGAETQAAAGPAAVIEAAGLDDLEEVGRWTFKGGIEVRLLARPG